LHATRKQKRPGRCTHTKVVARHTVTHHMHHTSQQGRRPGCPERLRHCRCTFTLTAWLLKYTINTVFITIWKSTKRICVMNAPMIRFGRTFAYVGV
jgi:hypothetical protein